MGWLPATVDQLRIGLFVKVDHPFVRNTFMISSPSEIAIIRQYGLTKIFYDPDRSSGGAVTETTAPAPNLSAGPDSELTEMIAEDEQAMRKEKAAHIRQIVDHRKALKETAAKYDDSTKRCSAMMAMMSAGQPEGVQQASEMADALVSLLSQQTVVLSLVHTEASSDPGQELAMQAMNMTALATLTGKSMKLPSQQLQHLSLGSMFYQLGQDRIPPAIRAKGAKRSQSEAKEMQRYPQFGKEMLEAIPGVPREVIDIVHQHREYLDGSGYPRGLTNGDISQLARLVGTVTEYTELTKNGAGVSRVNPTHALSHLYVRMKEKLGADVIEPFIATMTVYPPGTYVEMSDRSVGKVVKTNAEDRMRPVVMLYDPASAHEEAAVIDLSRERGLWIQKSLTPQSIPQPVLELLNPGRVEGYLLSPLLA